MRRKTHHLIIHCTAVRHARIGAIAKALKITRTQLLTDLINQGGSARMAADPEFRQAVESAHASINTTVEKDQVA